MTPLDIEMKEFKKAIIGGYNTDHVDNFMGQVTREFEHIQREKIELEHKVDRLNDRLDHYKSMEQTLQSTMILAEQTARNAENEANKKAEQLLLESTFESDQMVESARDEVYTIKQNIDGLQKQYKTARVQIKQMLQNQLEILDTQDNNVEELTAITANMSDAFDPQSAIGTNDMASALEPLQPLVAEDQGEFEYESLDALDGLDSLDRLGESEELDGLDGLDAIEEMNKKMAMETDTEEDTIETIDTMEQMETMTSMNTINSPDDTLDTSAPLSSSGQNYYSNDTFYSEDEYYEDGEYEEEEEDDDDAYYSNEDYYEVAEEEEKETPVQPQNEDFYTKEYQIINEEDVI